MSSDPRVLKERVTEVNCPYERNANAWEVHVVWVVWEIHVAGLNTGDVSCNTPTYLGAEAPPKGDEVVDSHVHLFPPSHI